MLLMLLASPGLAMAQSSNGIYTLMGETTTSGGGQIGGGNPMQAQTILGMPAGGAASNSTYVLTGGMTGSASENQTSSIAITVTGTVDDPSSTVTVNGVTAVMSGATFTASGIQVSLGPNTLTAVATDSLGNQRSHTITVYVDLPAAKKTPRFSIPVTGTVNDNSAIVDVNGVGATVTSGQFTASVPLVSGYNTLTTTAHDPAGNQTVTSIEVFVPVTLPPPMPTVGTTGPPIPSVTTATSVTIGGTKTPGTSIWINGVQVVPANSATTWTATLALIEGDNDLVIVAKDATGTPSAPARRTIIVDNLPPVITCSPPSKTNFNPYELTGQVDDSGTTVVVNGLVATRAGRTFTVPIPINLGPNALHLTAASPNGYTTTRDYTMILGTIPTIQTSQPADGAKAYAGTAITLQVTAQDQQNDPIQCQFLIDGSPLADWSSVMSQAWTPGASLSGVHTVTVKVRDNYGGSNSKDVEVMVVRPPINHP